MIAGLILYVHVVRICLLSVCVLSVRRVLSVCVLSVRCVFNCVCVYVGVF